MTEKVRFAFIQRSAPGCSAVRARSSTGNAADLDLLPHLATALMTWRPFDAH